MISSIFQMWSLTPAATDGAGDWARQVERPSVPAFIAD